MSSKMVVRILSISLALIFLGVFVPCLTNGAVNPPTVNFGEVAVGSQDSQLLNISNGNGSDVSVYFFIYYKSGNDCGFSLSYNGETLTPAADGNIYLPGDSTIVAGGSVNVEVIFAPTEPPVTCSADLYVVAAGVAKATLSGTGIEAPAKSATVVIDGQDTGVPDFEYEKEKWFSERLDEIAAEARNHGQYVRWVFFWTRRAHKNDMLDREEMKAILKAAAHANIPKDGVIKGRKEKHQNGRHAGRFGFHGGHHK